MDAGAGNRLHPGPGPIGPGPGPWSELNVVEVAVRAAATSKLGALATGRLARACMARSFRQKAHGSALFEPEVRLEQQLDRRDQRQREWREQK